MGQGQRADDEVGGFIPYWQLVQVIGQEASISGELSTPVTWYPSPARYSVCRPVPAGRVQRAAGRDGVQDLPD